MLLEIGNFSCPDLFNVLVFKKYCCIQNFLADRANDMLNNWQRDDLSTRRNLVCDFLQFLGLLSLRQVVNVIFTEKSSIVTSFDGRILIVILERFSFEGVSVLV